MKRNPRLSWLLLVSALVILAVLSTVAVGARVERAQPAGDGPGLSLDPSMPPLVTGEPAGEPVYAAPRPAQAPEASFQSAADAPTIDIWYGKTQNFGQNGDPQKWVNILGTVSGQVDSLTYSLNGGPSMPLNMGPDNSRLAEPGDFNIELDYTQLNIGANQVTIVADGPDGKTTANVTVNYQTGPSWAPGTYTYNWNAAGDINDIAQITDGKWEIVAGGIEPTVIDFDRMIAVGDMSWRDYTVTVPITIHGIDSSGFAAPSNGPGVGYMVRWQGHYPTAADQQPNLGWRRLGALGWYRWQKVAGNVNTGLQLLGDGGGLLGEKPLTLDFETTYIFKLQVESATEPTEPATYRFKVYPASGPEPGTWDIVSVGKDGEPSGGSVYLIAHHVDATIGTVSVKLDSTRPRPELQVRVRGTGSGQVVTDPQLDQIRFGETVKLTAIPAAGSYFERWSGAVVGTDNPITLEIFEPAAVGAWFQLGDGTPQATATATATGQPTATPTTTATPSQTSTPGPSPTPTNTPEVTPTPVSTPDPDMPPSYFPIIIR